MSVIRFKHSSLPALVENFFSKDSNEFFEPVPGYSLPAVNIKDHAEGFSIELAAPGLRKEDFQIHLNQNILTISHHKEEKSESENGTYTRREFKATSFKRSFNLPSTVVVDQISAQYQDGILRLWVKKKDEARPRPERFIEIQ